MIQQRKESIQDIRQDYLMTDEMVAEMVKVPVNTIRYWRQTGVLPFVKIGKHPRIWNSDFLKVFKKPISIEVGTADTIITAGDVRRAM